MDKIIIEGGTPLRGQITLSGAKNACLTLMPAVLLMHQPLTLTRVPKLADISTMRLLLESLGVTITEQGDPSHLTLQTTQQGQTLAHYDIVRKMRASILVLGPLLASQGVATVSLPGGCAIGARPVDLHLQALEQMGASFELSEGYIHAKAPQGLHGIKHRFSFASVGATENVMMAATLAKGETLLENVACEPEIADLAQCLRAMGAMIEGEGTPTLRIQGVDSLHQATHHVLADRIELGTYMMAAAITGGELELIGGARWMIGALIDALDQADIHVADTDKGLKVSRRNGAIHPLCLHTAPFPGFPTDLQAQMMAVLALADGVSHIEECIFENRFMHVPELNRMGAKIDVHGGKSTITGVDHLIGAPVMATDLRASVSLVLAGLAARGRTQINRVYHLDRGYEKIEEKLQACGAKIWREEA